jgi:5-(aminomethyl)-3-furanmethanol phosphate kinase
VRAAQRTMKFSNAAAHDMALLAMEQYAYALADLSESLTLCETPEAAARAQARGTVALWRPFRMLRKVPEIDASWDITSDSLAAWYAVQSGARALLLIKSVDALPGGDPVASGVVDSRFHEFARGLTVFIAGPKALAQAAAVFASGAVPGLRVDLFARQQKVAS